MNVRLTTFASELTKIAAKKEERKSYLKQVGAAAPFAVASAISDVPKGMVDKYVEQAIVKAPKASSSLSRGLGRGAGRLTAGLATSPVFLSGIKDLQSDSKKDKKRGMAKVVGSGLAYSALKGGIEAGIEHYKTNPAKIMQKVRSTASARGIIGATSAALTAAAVAKATKVPKTKKKREKKGLGQYAAPAISGAILGGGKGAFEKAFESGLKVKPRALLGASAGRAASGALGAAAMTHLVKSMMPKTAEARQDQPVGPKGEQIYSQVSGWAKNRNDVDIYRFYKEVDAGGIGERSPSRRAAYYALNDELRRRGHKIEAPRMRDQVQEKVKAPGPVDTMALVAVASSPSVVWQVLGSMEPDEKDKILEDAVDRMFIQNKLHRIEKSVSGKPLVDAESAYEIGTNRVYLAPKGKAFPETVAHEVGHALASDLRKQTIGSARARQVMNYGRIVSVALPILAMDGANDGSFATRQELEARANFISRVGIVAAALQAPGLAEEAKASIDAVKIMRQAGAKKPMARALKRLLPAYATYAVPAALPFIAAARIRSKARKKSGRDRR